MSKHKLSKSTYIRSRQCQKSLYLHTKRPFLRDKLSPEQLAKFRRGTNIGILAQELFPGGIDMKPRSPALYQKMRDETKKLIQENSTDILYEAVFQHDDVLIMLDILVKKQGKWHAYEVKSSKAISEVYIEDAALQNYVIQGSGIQLKSFNLIYIDENYILGDQLDIEQLFIYQDVSKEVNAMMPEIQKSVAEAKITLELKSSPPIPIGMQCFNPYPCDFIGHCWKKVSAESVLHLQSLEQGKRFEMYYSGTENVSQITDISEFSEETQAEIQAIRDNKLHINEEVFTEVSSQLQNKAKQTAFVKLIITEAALPFIKGSNPYSFPPVAISYQVNNESVFISFEQSAEGLNRFVEVFSKLINENSLVVTDDVSTIKKCIQSYHPVLTEFSLDEEKIIGIKQILNSCQSFHPKLKKDSDISAIAKILGGKGAKLTHPLYIIKDIEEAASTEENEVVAAKLKAYTDAIKSAFTFLLQ